MRAVISFHAIDHQPGPLSFAPDKLDALLGAFADAELPVVSLPELFAAASRGVALTFDDGMASVYDAALPILRAHSAPAHVFLVTKHVAGDNQWRGQPSRAAKYPMLNWCQVEALHAAGVLIEGHTATHPDLRQLTTESIEAELDEADGVLASRLGRRPAYFAYPYGLHDARVRAQVARRYAACFTTTLDFLRWDTKPDLVPRLDSHYLRSQMLMHALEGHRVRSYLALRRLIRGILGRT